MTSYPVHTVASAPVAAKPTLGQLEQTFGLVPNVAGAMANSPELLTAFAGLFGQVHAGTFTEPQIQVLLLTNAVTNACTWAVAFHTMLALKTGVPVETVEAIRGGRLPADPAHAALSRLARRLIETRGHVDEAGIDSFLEAGFRPEQVLEILAVTAASTITNYAGTITRLPLEDYLERHAWQP